jgi:hypothetical protein
MNTESQSYTMYDSALKTFLEGESRLDLLQDADRLVTFNIGTLLMLGNRYKSEFKFG